MAERAAKTILLVEDEAIIAMSERKSLEKYGYSVVVAGNGERAIELIDSRQDIDLILMDIDLGAEMDGTEAAARILGGREVPIVFLSSHTEPDIVEKTERITSYGYVVKSAGITVLDASIKMAFKLFEANKKTLESEIKQTAMISNIADVIVVIDREGIIRYKSPNSERWFGWRPDETVGKNAWENIHPDDWERTHDFLGNLMGTPGASGTTECRYRRKDGDYRWIEITLVNLLDDPVIRGMLGNYRDVTERRRAEQERGFEQQFTSKLLDSLPGIFYLYSYPELRLVRWNRNHERLLGYGPGEIDGKHLFEWHLPGTEDAVRAAVDTAMERGQNALEAPLLSKDGSAVPFLMTGTPFEAAGRRYLMGIGIDVADRKRTEMDLSAKVAELRETRELFSLFMDHLPAVVFIKDREGRTLFTNKAMDDALGSKSWIGLTATEIFDPETARRIVEDDRRTLELGYQMIQERFPHLDGKLYDYETQKFTIPRAGKPPLLGGIAINVTERNLAEARLREKSAELDRYFASSLDLLCIANLDGIFIRLNPEWEHVLGYSVDELQGKAFLDFVHPDDRENTVSAVAALREQREVLSFENRYRTKDGDFRWIEWRSHPEGSLIYAAARDVTARKQAETELQKQLEEKEILLKEVHHRIKNNIASIEALLRMQATSLDDPEAAAALNEAIGRVDSMRILYEKLLVGETYEESSVKDYLESIVESVVVLFPDATRIAVRTRVDEFDLAPKKLFPLGIIVNELLTNVMKYAFVGRDGGSVALTLEKTGDSAVLVVRDDGIGLPDDFQASGTQRFGLMLVAMLGEQLGGRFTIESAGGTRCTLRFAV